jgi:hypothetical protein
MPITLSRLITKSATMTVFTAAHNLSLAWMLPCASSSSGSSSFTPIQTSSSAPISLSAGSLSRLMAKKISTTRSTMAPAVPQRMPWRRRSGGRRAAGQRDDDRVVATQQDVDHDDLAHGEPEIGVGKPIHQKQRGPQPPLVKSIAGPH